MIKPVNFFFNSETALSNVFQNCPELSEKEIKNRVTLNFNKTINILKKESIDIDVIDPVLMKDLPDQVFPNNCLPKKKLKLKRKRKKQYR